MEYGINIRFFEKELGIAKAAELVAKAGFTKLDYTPSMSDENWESKTREDFKIFASYGLSVHQTHIPFNRYGSYGTADQHRQYIERCIAATEMAGAKFTVAHGDEFDYERLTFSPEAALDYNHHYFLPYVERAARNGYKVAFETVFDDSLGRRPTSKEDELMALILSFQSDNAVCCWDFGHANISFKKDAPNVIKRFGSLIQCTHLHDNTGRDSHQMPMTGSIRWTETMSAFKEIGYDGVMSIEYSAGSMPAPLLEDFMRLTYQAAKHVWKA